MTDVLSSPSGGTPSGAVAASETGGLESAAGTIAAESRFPCLDGYRAIAALMVVLTHVGFETGRSVHGLGHSVLNRCDAGVPIFFVLSGFLLYRPMAYARLSGRDLPTMSDYLVRRGLRILPAYWVSVVLVMTVLQANASVRQHTGEWVAHLLLVQVYGATDRTIGLEQDWSLCVELSFYLFLPLWPRLLRLLARRRPSLRVEVVGAVALLVAPYVWISLCYSSRVLPLQAALWLPGHLDWFVCGMMLAVISVLPAVRPDLSQRWQWLIEVADSPMTCWLGAAAVFAVVVTPAGGRDDLYVMSPWQALSREFLFTLFAVLFLLPGFLGDQKRGLPRLLLRSWPLRQLGTMSYGIFVLHMGELFLTYQIMGYQIFGGHFWTVLGMVLGMAIVSAYISLRVIELPALRLKKRFGSSRPAVPPPAVSVGVPG
jgi:peptidoglycan/LPS O-acetylase OafA/YrhL